MKGKQAFPLILLAVIWGCYYVSSQMAVSGLSVFSAGIVIRLITMLLLTGIMLAKKELKLLLRVKGIWPRLLLIGLLGFLLDLTAFMGLSLSSAGSGTALLKCDVLFVNILSMIIYKQRFKKLDWICTFVMLLGVFMVMGISFSNFKPGGGDIFFILSALFVSINAFVIKGAQHDKQNPVGDHVIAFYNNLVTMVLFFFTSLFLGQLSELKTLLQSQNVRTAALLAGLGQTLVYLVYYYDLRRYPVWLVKVFLLLMPIVAAFVSYLLFGAVLQPRQWIGIVIVLSGAFGLLAGQRHGQAPPVH